MLRNSVVGVWSTVAREYLLCYKFLADVPVSLDISAHIFVHVLIFLQIAENTFFSHYSGQLRRMNQTLQC
jgi:hypothetical protein